MLQVIITSALPAPSRSSFILAPNIPHRRERTCKRFHKQGLDHRVKDFLWRFLLKRGNIVFQLLKVLVRLQLFLGLEVKNGAIWVSYSDPVDAMCNISIVLARPCWENHNLKVFVLKID